MQILAGNARKVSAVRFERIDEDVTNLNATSVTRVVPRIVKRKCNDDMGKTGSAELPFPKKVEGCLAEGPLIDCIVEDFDNNSK